jgi:hypothetical protein
LRCFSRPRPAIHGFFIHQDNTMNTLAINKLVFGCALGALAACSQGAGTSGGSTASNAGGGPSGESATTTKISGSVCDLNLLTAADLVGVLDKPVTGTKPLAGDAQTCIFITGAEPGAPQLSVGLRGGMGRVSIASYTSGHMDAYSKWEPLAGVGDGAVWIPQLHEVQAQQDDVLCDIQPDGLSVVLGNAAAQQKLGALCSMIFARLHLPQSATAASVPSVSGGNIVQTACEKDVAAADVAGILTAPLVKQGSTINPQSCAYHAAAGATVTITLANGDEGKFAWDIANNPANGRMDSLGGIGDSALQARGGTLVVARKGGMICTVDVTGTDNANGMQVITKDRGTALADKLGALCNKVFAAR